MNQDLTSYYNERAKEYDKVYSIPEEQQDLADAVKIVRELFSQKNVLEIACGTGYWTAQLSETVASIHATDINESVIKIAQSRNTAHNVTFEIADMYTLNAASTYNALFGGFIWSHILLQDLNRFLLKITGFLKPDSIIAFIDSKPVKDTVHDNKRISKTDEYGNTYQTRFLENGTSHLVLKNFPEKNFLIETLSNIATDINYIELQHYWIASATLKS